MQLPEIKFDNQSQSFTITYVKTIRGCLYSFILSLALAGAAHAQILWISTGTISGDTDVLTNGTYFDAAQLQREHSAAQTVNGVVFNAFNGGTTDSSGDISISGPIGQGTDSYSGGSLSTSYQAILTSAAYVNTGDTGVVTLNNLVSGQEYQVQIWNAAGRNTVYSGVTPLVLSGGDYAVGDFTDGLSSSLSFTFQANAAASSSYGEIFDVSVREVPEPSTYAMLLVGGLGLLLGVRRSRTALDR
jgi:hypothetical protein